MQSIDVIKRRRFESAVFRTIAGLPAVYCEATHGWVETEEEANNLCKALFEADDVSEIIKAFRKNVSEALMLRGETFVPSWLYTVKDLNAVFDQIPVEIGIEEYCEDNDEEAGKYSWIKIFCR